MPETAGFDGGAAAANPAAAQPIFDSHLHIVDPAHPLVANDGFIPEKFSVADYRQRVAGLAITGGAVVSGSFQAFDQGYLIDALRALGPGFVGVTQIPSDTSDQQILALHAAGVRAVRFNVVRGGSANLDDLDQLARRVHDLVGWHAELYLDAATIDAELAERISALPAVSIDHLGISQAGLLPLLRLVERGVKVKATGFGRISIDPLATIAKIVDIDPSALMVGTDLPSTRARRPFHAQDFADVASVVASEHVGDMFWGNAVAFYLRD